METPIQKIKYQLATDLIKAERDVHFKRAKHELLNVEIEKIHKAGKLENISPNEILTTAFDYMKEIEQALEAKYKVQYAYHSIAFSGDDLKP